MVGYFLDATNLAPMSWILCTLLCRPLFSFLPFFFPSRSLRDSDVILRKFIVFILMISFYSRETCWEGICSSNFAEHATSKPSNSRSPTSISSPSISVRVFSFLFVSLVSSQIGAFKLGFSYGSCFYSVCPFFCVLLIFPSCRVSNLL